MRKEQVIKIDDRGKELTFKIREMPATQAEAWLMRAILLICPGILGKETPAALSDVDPNSLLSGLGAVKYEAAKPLLDELLGCCTRIDGGIEQVCTPETVDGYIEDLKTLFKLRIEAAKLNFGFFANAAH